MELPLKEKVVRRLQFSPRPLAVHEFGIPGVSDNNLATRLSEYAREGIVVGKNRMGCSYKEWMLARREKNGQFLLF
jgi:hypothetical protein